MDPMPLFTSVGPVACFFQHSVSCGGPVYLSFRFLSQNLYSVYFSVTRTPEAGEDSVTSINDEYYNETFESEATQSVTRTHTQTGTLSSRPSPGKKPVQPSVSPAKDGAKSPSKSPIKSASPSPARKTSESESEDSYSVAGMCNGESGVIDGLAQDCSISSVLAMEILLSCFDNRNVCWNYELIVQGPYHRMATNALAMWEPEYLQW